MARPRPYYRASGEGPGVVCFHSNAATGAQWRSLTERLAPTHRVYAPDSYGAGKSPAWTADRFITLADEVDLVEPVLEEAGPGLTLVGHSYGGAIALMAALRHRDRLRALVLYEPTLFALVDAQTPPPNGADGIKNAVHEAIGALDAGDRDAAARHFIDFWMGEGAWAATPDSRKPAIADSLMGVRGWAHALVEEPTPLESFRRLDIPVLYMTGAESPEPAHAVARVLAPALPHAEIVEFPGLGHMAPITHAERVNEAIAGFLGRL